MLKNSFTILLMTFIIWSCKGQHQYIEKLKNNFQGKWICLQDSNYSLLVIGDSIIEKYNNEQADVFSFSISKNNCGFEYSLEGACFLLKKHRVDKDEYCYKINVSETNLNLNWEGGRVSDFTRKNE